MVKIRYGDYGDLDKDLPGLLFLHLIYFFMAGVALAIESSSFGRTHILLFFLIVVAVPTALFMVKVRYKTGPKLTYIAAMAEVEWCVSIAAVLIALYGGTPYKPWILMALPIIATVQFALFFAANKSTLTGGFIVSSIEIYWLLETYKPHWVAVWFAKSWIVTAVLFSVAAAVIYAWIEGSLAYYYLSSRRWSDV